jgi:DNA-binding transcriptional MocR family regulator
MDSGGGLNPFTGAIVRGLVENGGLKANIAQLCATYQARAAAMEAALRRYLPGASFQAPQGGYFFWVRFPGIADTESFLERAEACQVSYRPGGRFSSRGGLGDYARLCFACYKAERLIEGVMRLARALEA